MRGTGTAVQRNQASDKDNWWSYLPFDLQNVKVTAGSRPVGFRYSSFIFNIEADLGDNAIVACGEDQSADLAMTKAVAELVERATMLNWSKKGSSQLRTSSGWAAHDNEQSCKQSAILELVERDAVLAQWYSRTSFIEIDPKALPDSIRIWAQSELCQSEFPRLHLLLSTEGVGPSVSCLFLNENGFGVSGHATKANLFDSIESAIAETCRAAHLAIRKSFMDDSVQLKNSIASRVDPGAHAVYYAYHEPFPQWMFGRTATWEVANQVWQQKITQLNMDSFRFEVALQEPFVVGVASHPEIFEVSWGSTVENEINKKIQSRKYRPGSRILNLKPHIVS